MKDIWIKGAFLGGVSVLGIALIVVVGIQGSKGALVGTSSIRGYAPVLPAAVVIPEYIETTETFAREEVEHLVEPMDAPELNRTAEETKRTEPAVVLETTDTERAQGATCPFEDKPGRVIVSFTRADGETVPLRADSSRRDAQRVGNVFNIPAGKYAIRLATVVDRDTSALSDSGEQWLLRFLNEKSEEVARTNATRDLEDGESKAVEQVSSSFEVPDGTYSVIARHALYSTDEPHFVVPLCAALDTVSGQDLAAQAQKSSDMHVSAVAAIAPENLPAQPIPSISEFADAPNREIPPGGDDLVAAVNSGVGSNGLSVFVMLLPLVLALGTLLWFGHEPQRVA